MSRFAVVLAVCIASCEGCFPPPPGGNDAGALDDASVDAGASVADAGFILRPPDPNDPDNESLDSDCDGLSDADEYGTVYASGGATNPADPDSDDDGVLDGVELGRTSSVDPLCPQFAGDGCPQGRTDPLLADTDRDGLDDGDEDRSADGCVDVAAETDPNNPDSDGDGTCDGPSAVPPVCDAGPDTTPVPVGVDADADGLPDALDPTDDDPDTDDDGLCDGPATVAGTCVAGEDLNADGVVQRGESDPTQLDTDCDGIADFEEVTVAHTDPANADTDGDGLLDGIEVGSPARAALGACAAFAGDADTSTTTDPKDPDSDGDDIPDGAEDGDADGAVDPGELDPNDAGDGADPTIHAACALDALVPLASRVVPEADLQIALPRIDAGAFGDVVTLRDPTTNVPVGVAGHDAARRVAYVAYRRAPAGADVVQDEAALENEIDGVANLTDVLTRAFTTWDGYAAVSASSHMAGNVGAVARANAIVTALLGAGAGALTTTNDAPATDGFVVATEVVRRSDLTTIVLVALAPAELAGGASGLLVRDLADGSALGQAVDTTGAVCDRVTSEGNGQLDVLWAVDNSASMAAKQQAVATAGAEVQQRIDASGVDFRTAAVTSGFYATPANAGCTNTVCGESTGNQCRAFTTDTATMVKWFTSNPADPAWLGAGNNSNGFDCDVPIEAVAAGAQQVLTSGGVAGGATFLPAQATPDATHLRQDTNLLVVFIGDADDQSPTNSSNDAVAIDATVDAYETFFRALPVRSVQMGGVVCPDGATCGEDRFNDPRVLQSLINRFGGVTGSIVDPATIPTAVDAIIDAAIIGASPYVLSRAPITSTVKVAMDAGATIGTCDTNNVPRSRTDGFDVDPVTRTVAFFGACRPDPARPGAQIAISYRVWIDQSPVPDPPQPACAVCSSCTGIERCDLDACACICDGPLTCRDGFGWSDADCACNCDVDALACDARHDASPDLCACTCGDDCNGQCGAQTVCNASTCACTPIGG